MNLQDIRVLILSQYAAPYEGNFILSLKHLESNLSEKYNAQIAYVFPMAAKAQPWYDGFIKQHKTYLTTDNVHRSEKEVLSIMVDFHPSLVHTHFDGYDVPCAKAINAYEKEKGETINMVWHLHDTLGYVSNPIKIAYQFYSFLKHYGWYGRHANIIAVGKEVAEFVLRCKKRVTLSPYKNLQIIANGVDFSRLTGCAGGVNRACDKFTFLSFGGRNVQKRVDILMKAGQLLKEKGVKDFEIRITNGTDTMQVVEQLYGANVPSWLKVIPQCHNISEVFASADCFVSSSITETFSYAICEATIFGLPVIQSNIEGTLWNAENPSAYLFKSEDVNDLSEKMLQVMTAEKDILLKNCETTKNNNHSKYSLDTWTKNVIDFYKTI